MTTTQTSFTPKKTGEARKVISSVFTENFVSLVGRRMVLRGIFTIVMFGIFILLLYLLFFRSSTLPDRTRDLLNITLGAYIASFTKIIDFWFKKDDEDTREDKVDPFD